jgi:TolA-binding protein
MTRKSGPLLSGVLILLAAGASAGSSSRPGARGARERADALYQSGVDLYAAGRFPEALASFRDALRADPSDRDARLAANRVVEEMTMTTSAPPKTPPLRSPSNDGGGSLSRLERFFAFDWALAEEREREGRLRAMQGRIAQLLAEKHLSRGRRRAFLKDAELHALSRRLA